MDPVQLRELVLESVSVNLMEKMRLSSNVDIAARLHSGSASAPLISVSSAIREQGAMS